MTRQHSISRTTRARIVAGFGSAIALTALLVACNENGGVNTPANTPHGTNCFTDYDCMSFQHCVRAMDHVVGSCFDREPPASTTDEGGAPIAPPGSSVDGGTPGTAPGEIQI